MRRSLEIVNDGRFYDNLRGFEIGCESRIVCDAGSSTYVLENETFLAENHSLVFMENKGPKQQYAISREGASS